IVEQLLFARKLGRQTSPATPQPACMPRRKAASQQKQGSGILAGNWRMCRATKGWNGNCLRCGAKAKAGQLVSYDRDSGVPSLWKHVDCTFPYDSPKAPSNTESLL